MKLAFVWLVGAGRRRMATAFAERERDVGGTDAEFVTGGVDPALRNRRVAARAAER